MFPPAPADGRSRHSPVARRVMAVRLVSQEEPLPGYRLIERLGRGGFGEVWKAEAPGGLLKAIKFVFGDLDAAGDEEARPAEQELKALKRIQSIRHPYILSLERYDVVDGQLMIVMELADKNLWDRFRECRAQGQPGIGRDELLRYMEQTAEALDLMNNHFHIQHLDVKPQNLFLVYNYVKVADFGLAKDLEVNRERVTITGGVTPVYAAPETFEGKVSRFTDQYSLAIVFQELLTGVRPFGGTNTRALMLQHISGTPDLKPLPAADQPVIARGLAKNPDARWPTCTDMVRALRLAGSTPSNPVAGGGGFDSSHGSSVATRFVGIHPAESSGGHTRPAADDPAVSSPTRIQTPRPGPDSPPPTARRPFTPSPHPLHGTPVPYLGGGLATPKLVTPNTSAGPNPALTLQRGQIFQTARMGSLGLAPPEKNGDGVLFPALLIGLGQTGRVVLEKMRQLVADKVGSPDRVPNLRFLHIDTDPAPPAASHGLPLAARETIVARLNRAAHYLQRDNLPPVEQWMPPGALYKLPRTPGAADGVRAFGRLALCDNYRLIAQRLRQEVEALITDDPIAQADKATRLGLRTNRVRAYVVAGLGGGTGGGMFLDVAFLIRHELRQVGYVRPEVAGVFFVPPAGKTAPRTPALGNAHAALTELHHFQAKQTRYQTTFDRGEAAIQDADAPFARTAVLELPKRSDPREHGAVLGRAARALFHETLTPAGRVADEVRDVYRNAYPVSKPVCQTFGLFRLSWPRAEMLAVASARFAEQTLGRWTSKEAGHLRGPVGQWLAQQWEARKLGFESLIGALNAATRDALREDPDKVFDALIEPLRAADGRSDPAAVRGVLEGFIRLVGRLDAEGTGGTLAQTLAGKFEDVGAEAEKELAFVAVQLIEQPQYRLAGAEEAVRQIGDRLNQQVETLVPVRAELLRETAGGYGRLLQALAGPAAVTWKGPVPTELLELLRSYPRKRLQLHVLDTALAIYRKLVGNAPEYLRELSCCRSTLADLQAAVGKSAPAAPEPIGPGQMILPQGCGTLADAADQFLGGLAPEELLAFDQDMQDATRRKFRALVNVCVKPTEKGTPFRDLLLQKSRQFLDGKLDRADPAAVFFRYRDGAAARALVTEAYEEAVPEPKTAGGEPGDEVMVLAAPPGPAGDRFRAVVRESLPAVDWTPAPLADDIVLYRERPQVDLSALPQLGDVGRDAFLAMQASEHPAHARTDVAWQAPNG